jgi:ribonuclease HI
MADSTTPPITQVTVHTDGGCQGNPGVGGWGAVLVSGKHRREIKGGEPATTNNRMEITAALQALKSLNRRCKVEIHTDSQYLRQGITAWIKGWKRNGWRTAAKTPVKNADLWRTLDELTNQHDVTWCWVKGHAGNEGNELCDGLAGAAMAEIRKQFSPGDLDRALRDFKKLHG